MIPCQMEPETGVGRCKHLMEMWGITRMPTLNVADERTPQSMEPLLVWPLLPEPCSLDDLAVYNPCARTYVLQNGMGGAQ